MFVLGNRIMDFFFFFYTESLKLSIILSHWMGNFAKESPQSQIQEAEAERLTGD